MQISRAGTSLTFTGQMVGPQIELENDFGVWQSFNNNFELIAREGDPLLGPGLGEESIFTSIGAVQTNERGMVLLRGQVAGPTVSTSLRNGFYVAAGGAIQAVAIEKSDTLGPGFGPGVSFYSIERPAIDETGPVVFRGFVSGPGYNSGNNVGIWRWKDGKIANVLLKGQMFDVNPDPAIEDFRRIDDIDFDFRSLSQQVNESGNAPFVVRMDFGFGGNTAGVYVLTPVPEPTTMSLVALAMLLLVHKGEFPRATPRR